DLGGDRRAVRLRLVFQQLELGAAVLAKAPDVRDACGLRRLLEELEAVVVAVDQRMPVRLDPLEDLRLRLRDLLEAPEVAEMRGRDQRHDTNVRAHQLHQRSNFAGVIHADLEDRVRSEERRVGKEWRRRWWPAD